MYNYSVMTDTQKDKGSAAVKNYYFGDEPVLEKTARQLIQVSMTWKKVISDTFPPCLSLEKNVFIRNVMNVQEIDIPEPTAIPLQLFESAGQIYLV